MPFCTNISLFSIDINFTFSYKPSILPQHIKSLYLYSQHITRHRTEMSASQPQDQPEASSSSSVQPTQGTKSKIFQYPLQTSLSSAHPLTYSTIRSTRSKNLRSVQQARRGPREQTSQGLLNMQIGLLLLARVHKSTLQGSQEGVCKASSGVLKDCCIQACSEEFGTQGGT